MDFHLHFICQFCAHLFQDAICYDMMNKLKQDFCCTISIQVFHEFHECDAQFLLQCSFHISCIPDIEMNPCAECIAFCFSTSLNCKILFVYCHKVSNHLMHTDANCTNSSSKSPSPCIALAISPTSSIRIASLFVFLFHWCNSSCLIRSCMIASKMISCVVIFPIAPL
jgi:hypothetical protein